MDDKSTEETEYGEEVFMLRLFVSGTSPNSVKAINNLKAICESNLAGRYELEIIDIHQQPELVKNDDVAAVPMLIKNLPLPKRRLVGDMSEKDKVLKGLGLL